MARDERGGSEPVLPGPGGDDGGGGGAVSGSSGGCSDPPAAHPLSLVASYEGISMKGYDSGLPDRVDVGFDHLSWPSVNAARGGSLRLIPPSSTGTGTMRAGGGRSQPPAGEHARHHSLDPLRHASYAISELWVMHSWGRM